MYAPRLLNYKALVFLSENQKNTVNDRKIIGVRPIYFNELFAPKK
jgi:hypothetical protein